MKFNYIRSFILSAFLIFTAVLFCRAQDTEKVFKDGVEAYAGGDYLMAIESWEKLISSGYSSAGLYYNLANANFKAGSLPGAILYYEKALLLKPFDEDIRYNLEIVRTYISDEFETVPEIFFVKWVKMLSLIFNSNQWATASLILFVLALLLVLFYLFSSRIRTKKISFLVGLIFLLFSIFSVFLSYTNHIITEKRPYAIIFSPTVTGKSSPDENGSDLFVIHEGTRVKVEDQIGEWIEVRLSDGNIGWIKLIDARKV